MTDKPRTLTGQALVDDFAKEHQAARKRVADLRELVLVVPVATNLDDLIAAVHALAKLDATAAMLGAGLNPPAHGVGL